MNTLPPLIALADGRRVRPRRAPIIRPKEIELHMTVAKLLREHCLEGWDWTHVATGELENMRKPGRMKQLGVRQGWPDFILLSPSDQPHFLELKRIGESLSSAQHEFRLRRIAHGTPFAICNTIDQVLAAFDLWKCTRLSLSDGAHLWQS
jgi:hypothetical protein